jgi:hypothetical protein
MLRVNSLLHTAIVRRTPQPDSYGLLYVLGELDDLVHTPIERASFDALCDDGMRLQYLECAGASHTRATAWSYPEILSFIDARLAGEPLLSSTLCQRGAAVTCSATPEP